MSSDTKMRHNISKKEGRKKERKKEDRLFSSKKAKAEKQDNERENRDSGDCNSTSYCGPYSRSVAVGQHSAQTERPQRGRRSTNPSALHVQLVSENWA